MEKCWSLSFLFALVRTGSGQVEYKWFEGPFAPYGSDMNCSCAAADYGRFTSYEECTAAFAGDPQEYCLNNGSGIGFAECDHAVSKFAGITNDACKHQCFNVGLGKAARHHLTSPIEVDDGEDNQNNYADDVAVFNKYCKLEYYRTLNGQVKTDPGSCFDHWLYGYGDSDPTLIGPAADYPLKVIQHVRTPAECQLQCQQDDHCSRWNWRALPDDEPIRPEESDGFEYPPFTCTLLAAEEVEGSLNINTDDLSAPFVPADPRHIYCDMERAASQCPKSELPLLQQLRTIGRSQDLPCLRCECAGSCVFRSQLHLGGPKYCAAADANACRVPAAHTTTLPPTTSPEPPCPHCHCHNCRPCACSCFDHVNCPCHSSDYCMAQRRRVLHEQIAVQSGA